MPGYRVALLGDGDRPAREGEICLSLEERPVGLMRGYRDDPAKTAHLMRGGHYHCGDVATVDDEGYLTYVGRMDDVFKSSDYRISPFELESALIEHEAVAEAAVVPSPDPRRLTVPKAFLVLRDGYEPSRELALSIFEHIRATLAPYKRIRRIEITDLPKTISGKIRRSELSRAEKQRPVGGDRGEREFFEEDFVSELKA
jgi:acetyl-CoA synthetase